PKYSPDGSQVAYWIGSEGVAAVVPGSGSVWVVPAAGGEPQRVGANFTAARYPIWSPDGKHLLFVGYTSAKTYERAIDWWLVALKGGEVVRTGAYDALIRAGLQMGDSAGNPPAIPIPSVPRPGCWSAANNSVLFSADSGDTRNLWEAGI